MVVKEESNSKLAELEAENKELKYELNQKVN